MESRAAVLAGAGALAVVLLLAIWLEQPAVAPPARLIPPPALATVGAVDVPTPASASPGDLAVGEEPPLAPAPLADIAADPGRYAGLRFRCRNRVVTAPLDWSPDAGGLLPLLERIGRPVARHRLALSCEARDLRVWPVLAFFEMRRDAPPPQVAPGDVVALTVLGASPTGALMTMLERDALPARGQLPLRDLRAVAADPAAHVGDVVPCRATSAATLRQLDALSATERAALQAAAEVGAAVEVLAEVRCEQRDGPGVSVLLAGPQRTVDGLLAIRPGADVQLRVGGVSDNRLIGAVLAVDVAHGDAQAPDLRHVLVDPAGHRGQSVHCVSMGLPQPQPLAPAEAGALPGGDALALTKAWVVCRQAAAPPVNLTLRFARGDVASLLAIGRGTELRAEVLGVAQGAIVGKLVEVVSGGLDEASQRTDLRRFVALRDNLEGSRFVCQVGSVVAAPGTAGAARPAARLFAEAVEPTPVRVHCVDQLRPQLGQPFELYFASAAQRLTTELRPGARVPMRFVGVTHATPVVGLDDEQRVSRAARDL